MKAEELMIGDWVRMHYPFDMDIDMRPERINVLTKGVDIDCEAIPLTLEILEKNGFIKDEDKGKEFGQTYHILIPAGYEAHSFTVQVTIYKEPIQGVDVLFKCWGWIPPFNGGLDDIHLCSLKYVHQLQHALRLCGITHEISL